MKKTVLINFYAGPGAGKSTTSAKIFAALKDRGECAELIQEYVKTWAWEGKKLDLLIPFILMPVKCKRKRTF